MMPSVRAAQITATGVASASLLVLTTFVTWLLAPGESLAQTALATNASAGLTAFAAWSGALFRRKDVSPPESWGDWVGVFFASSLLSGLLLSIDCGFHLPEGLGGEGCDGNPGISVIFTIAALSMMAIALPSALRAFLLASLSPPAEDKDKD